MLRGEGLQLLQRHLLYFQYLKTKGEGNISARQLQIFIHLRRKRKLYIKLEKRRAVVKLVKVRKIWVI